MVTRGEGGGNATGTEIGPALGLRRENEDRVAHYRSGTIDIFNVDSVDFFYNTSAPLTQFFWGTETLRRVTRIIRMTQPDIYIGFSPSLAAGHGNHQMAGRYIWEGVKAAADPNMFPEQLTGPNALSTWQVKKIFSGGSTGRHRRHDGGRRLHHRLPARRRPTWTRSRASGPATTRRTCGRPATSRAVPRARRRSGRRSPPRARSAYPTQSRTMNKGTSNPGCSRFGMTDSFVPFQPNANADGTANPAAGKDEAILYGATRPDPGGLPAGTLEYLSFSRFFNTPGTPFDVTVNLRSGSGTLAAGTIALTVPAGLDRRLGLEAGRHGRRQPLDDDVHGHAARGRRGRRDVQDRRALHDRQRDRLHG